MKRCFFLLFISIFSFYNLCAYSHCACGKTYFSNRSQDSYQYLYMTLNAPHRFIYGNEALFFDIDFIIGYEDNFKREKLSSYFFSPSGCLTVGPNNEKFNVRASDFGLGADFEGSALLKPRYSNALVYFDLFVGIDNVLQGLWGEIMIPFLTLTHWNPNLCTSIRKNSSYNYYTVPDDVGLVSAGQNQNVVTKATTNPVPLLFFGNRALKDALNGQDEYSSFGDAAPIYSGRIYNQDYAWQAISNLHFTLGYNFLKRERGNLGVAIDFVPGIGNSPGEDLTDMTYWNVDLFQGFVGSQNRTRLGGILRGQYELWNNDTDKSLAIYSELSAYNMFKGKTTRILGLCVGNSCAFNNWLLLKKYVLIDGVGQYLGLERACNLLRAVVETGNNLELQFNLMVQYKINRLAFSLGYNFYDRGAEYLNLCYFGLSDPSKYSYVINGQAPVLVQGTTQGGGFYSSQDSDVSSTGTLVEGSQVANVPASLIQENEIDFFNCGNNLNLQAAAHPRYTSNTIFGSLSYTLDSSFKPTISLIGKVELGKGNSAMDMWGFYFSGSIAF
jgi:hypothetical protein